MKLVLSEFEGDAIKYCFDLISNEKCIISIVHENDICEWGNYLCMEALVIQKKWEVYRAYKDIRVDHKIEYLGYPLEDYEQVLAAYLQLRLLLGVYSTIVYPKKYSNICKALIGNVELIEYSKEDTDLQVDQEKALSRLKLIKI